MEIEVGSLYKVRLKYTYYDDTTIQQCVKVTDKFINIANILTSDYSTIYSERYDNYEFTYIGKLPTLQELAKQHYPELFI